MNLALQGSKVARLWGSQEAPRFMQKSRKFQCSKGCRIRCQGSNEFEFCCISLYLSLLNVRGCFMCHQILEPWNSVERQTWPLATLEPCYPSWKARAEKLWTLHLVKLKSWRSTLIILYFLQTETALLCFAFALYCCWRTKTRPLQVWNHPWCLEPWTLETWNPRTLVI